MPMKKGGKEVEDMQGKHKGMHIKKIRERLKPRCSSKYGAKGQEGCGIKWMHRRRKREGRMTGYKRINNKKGNKVILCHLCSHSVEKTIIMQPPATTILWGFNAV
jgi:hypothetical protein